MLRRIGYGKGIGLAAFLQGESMRPFFCIALSAQIFPLSWGAQVLSVSGTEVPDTAQILRNYVRSFNATDEELYTNAIPNAAAEDFLMANVPRFACPDKDVERAYYFRWWAFRKHLRHDLGIWTVTEFLPYVGWSGKGNTIVCAAGHHLYEGRWLRDPQYMSDYARFWLTDKEATHRWRYSSWLYTGTCRLAAVTGRSDLPEELLDAAIAYYRRWERGFRFGKRPMGGDGNGGFVSVDSHEGTEISLGGNGYKPLMSSAMWSEATCIAEVARRVGRVDVAEEFAEKARKNLESIMRNCWNAEIGFFTTGSAAGRKGCVRELHGYAPWYFDVPTGKKPDWMQLLDANGFAGRFGLTFPERRAFGFRIDFHGHECKWNGPSWPFATSIALTALMNDLHAMSGGRDAVRVFQGCLHQYAAAHKRKSDGKCDDVAVVPWIDENLNPDNGEWLARKIILDTPSLRRRYPRERGKDYNHSTFCDLVISGFVGVVPGKDGGLMVDPLAPDDWDYFVLANLRYCGHDVDIRWQRGKGLDVAVDGRVTAHREDLAGPVRIGRAKFLKN